jgi:hypothetical protein
MTSELGDEEIRHPPFPDSQGGEYHPPRPTRELSESRGRAAHPPCQWVDTGELPDGGAR